MSFRKALHALERFRPRTPLRVRPAGTEDIEALVEMAWAGGLEAGKTITAHTADSLRDYYRALLESEVAEVFLVEREGKARGMVSCAMTPPDPWDDRQGVTVWALYTVPAERNRPDVASALLSAATEQCFAWGAKRFRVVIPQDELRLIARYEKTFGFRRESVQYGYLLDAEE